MFDGWLRMGKEILEWGSGDGADERKNQSVDVLVTVW
jgi:hypothetical protein